MYYCNTFYSRTGVRMASAEASQTGARITIRKVIIIGIVIATILIVVELVIIVIAMMVFIRVSWLGRSESAAASRRS